MYRASDPVGQVKVRVRLFALARQLAGRDTLEILAAQPATVRDVRRGLVQECPALKGMMGQMMIAVDSEYADDATPVTGSSEVACIPPVSGG